MSIAPSHAVAIVNPATRGNAKRIVELLQAAAPRSTQLDVVYTDRAGHASELAREYAERADLLIAVGGDGTVADVAGAVRGSAVSIGIVPGGSTNIIARELRIPTNPARAVQLLFGAHQILTVDAGLSGDRTFLHMAGAGIDSMLFSLAKTRLKRRIGWMAYVPAAVEALRHPMSHYSVVAEEMQIDHVRSPLVLVANGASIIAPKLQLDSQIRFDDGLLNVMVVTATTPVELAMVLGRMAMRRMSSSPYVTSFTTKSVEIVATPEIAVQLDGDVVGTTPAKFTIDPASVHVVVPISSTK